MRWMLTIAHRSRPSNTEWQYKTIVSQRPPEVWLAHRLEAVELGEHPRLEVNILFAREITDEAAEALERILEARNQK